MDFKLPNFEITQNEFPMLTQTSKNTTRRRVHERIRKKLMGTSERPRLNVYRSLNHIYVQVIDDLKGVTLVSASSAEGKKESRASGGNLLAAKSVGKAIADRAKGAVPVRVKVLVPRDEEGKYLKPEMSVLVTFFAK